LLWEGGRIGRWPQGAVGSSGPGRSRSTAEPSKARSRGPERAEGSPLEVPSPDLDLEPLGRIVCRDLCCANEDGGIRHGASSGFVKRIDGRRVTQPRGAPDSAAEPVVRLEVRPGETLCRHAFEGVRGSRAAAWRARCRRGTTRRRARPASIAGAGRIRRIDPWRPRRSGQAGALAVAERGVYALSWAGFRPGSRTRAGLLRRRADGPRRPGVEPDVELVDRFHAEGG